MNIPKPSGSSQNYQYQPQFTNFNQPQQPANFQFQPQYIPNQRSPTMPAQQTSTNLPAQQKVPIHTAFFSNIQYNVSAETFIEFAKKYGEIMNMYNLIPKKGLAFVTYYNIKDAKNAVDKANNQMLEGRQVKTNYAKKSSYPQNDPRTTCSALLVRTMPGSKLTLEKIKTEMSKFGEIYSFNESEQNLYFIKFCDIRDAQKAVIERNIGDDNVNIDFKIDDEYLHEDMNAQQQQFRNQIMANYPPPPSGNQQITDLASQLQHSENEECIQINEIQCNTKIMADGKQECFKSFIDYLEDICTDERIREIFSSPEIIKEQMKTGVIPISTNFILTYGRAILENLGKKTYDSAFNKSLKDYWKDGSKIKEFNADESKKYFNFLSIANNIPQYNNPAQKWRIRRRTTKKFVISNPTSTCEIAEAHSHPKEGFQFVNSEEEDIFFNGNRYYTL